MTLTVISITRTSGSTRRVIGCHRDEPEANVRSIPPRRFASLAQSGFLVHKPERADLTFYRLGVRPPACSGRGNENRHPLRRRGGTPMTRRERASETGCTGAITWPHRGKTLDAVSAVGEAYGFEVHRSPAVAQTPAKPVAYGFGKPFALWRCNDRDGRRSTMRLGEHHERTAPLAETCPRRPARLLTYTRVVRRHLAGRWATRVLQQQQRGNNIQHA